MSEPSKITVKKLGNANMFN